MSFESDVAWNEDTESFEDATNGVCYPGVSWTVVMDSAASPSGWPIVRFDGPDESLRLTALALCGGDEEQADELLLLRGECQASIWHGPGHQSRTRCEVKGPHEIHRARYGEFRQEASWRGDDVYSGFFDEAPCAEEDER